MNVRRFGLAIMAAGALGTLWSLSMLSPAPRSAPEAVVLPSAAARRDFAREFDSLMIDAGIESTTTTFGPDDETLKIKDPLAGRVRARQIEQVLPWKKLKSLGFKSVIYEDGFIDPYDLKAGFSEGWDVPQ